MAPTIALIDSGPLVAYYNARDYWHATARQFFDKFRGQLLLTESVVTEVMWLLSGDWRVQNEFLNDLKIEVFRRFRWSRPTLNILLN